MSVTGVALILFLTFHASMNIVALISARGYNMVCEFLGTNWYALLGTAGLAVLVILHFVYAIWLTLQNRKARGTDRYAVTDKPEKVEWASQNMLVLGFIVIVGIGIHLYNFWYNMMFAELAGIEGEIGATDGTAHIVNTFGGNWCYTIIYLLWLAAIWFHMTHGFWSAMQTFGWNGKVWFCRWRVISYIYTTIVVAMFAVIVVAFTAGYTPCDYETRNKPACEGPQMEQCDGPMAPAPCDMKGGCPQMKPGRGPEAGKPAPQPAPAPGEVPPGAPMED